MLLDEPLTRSMLPDQQGLSEGSEAVYANAMVDPLTGLLRRAYFEERLKFEWDTASREGRVLTLYLSEIDALAEYEDSHGRLEGEQCVRRVARAMRTCFRRTQDICGRLEYEQIAVLAARSQLGPSLEYAEVIQGRIRELHIPHAHSRAAGIVTISIGIASAMPKPDESCQRIVDAAQSCLRQAREDGGNRVIGRAV